ncbi:HD domain-containing protein [Haloimpatiens sp. FM7315]|uniref:HD domain-containing protein n=1 Tax=Haloimpatiens sp. FM7315 TaxID=3298609 RepID=UPI0035A344C5
MLYRIKQFLLAINSKITNEDKRFIKKYLNKDQLELFYKLKIHERKHAINVAKDVKRKCDLNNIKDKNTLVVAALLHDIGKIEHNLTLVDKSTLVILDKLTRGNMKKYKKIKKIDIYYNHPYKGYKILEKIGENKEVLRLVKNHHNNDIKKDLLLEILRECDDKN